MLSLKEFKNFEPKIFSKDEMYHITGGADNWTTRYTSYNLDGSPHGSGNDVGSNHSAVNNTTAIDGSMFTATWTDTWV